MDEYSVFVAFDTSKLRHAVAVVAAGWDGEVRYLGEIEATPQAVQDIARKAQTRLTARYRTLRRAGKLDVVAITAVARELAAFIWAIGQSVLRLRLPIN